MYIFLGLALNLIQCNLVTTRVVVGTGSELDIEGEILDWTASDGDIEVEGDKLETVTPRVVGGAGRELDIDGEILDWIRNYGDIEVDDLFIWELHRNTMLVIMTWGLSLYMHIHPRILQPNHAEK